MPTGSKLCEHYKKILRTKAHVKSWIKHKHNSLIGPTRRAVSKINVLRGHTKLFSSAEETKIMPMSWADLNSGNPAWAKKDQFHVARKVEGLGKKLLQKMGWTEGMGLGKNAQGNAEPLVLDFKINREGLSSTNESADGPSFMGRKVS